MSYWAFSVHSPWNARRDYIEHFKTKADPKKPQHNPLYAAMVRSLDDGIGRLLSTVDEAGIADRTIFVFFSDNGGWAYPPKATDPEGFTDIPATSNLPLRSGKASLYEGVRASRASSLGRAESNPVRRTIRCCTARTSIRHC